MSEHYSADFICSATGAEAFFIYDEKTSVLRVESRDETMNKETQKWYWERYGREALSKGMSTGQLICTFEEAKKIAKRYKVEF